MERPLKRGILLASLAMSLIPQDFMSFEDYENSIIQPKGKTMQKKLKGTQLRMKQFRGQSLAQSLGDINGRKGAKAREKALKKAVREHFRNTKQEPTAAEFNARLVEARRKEKLAGAKANA